MNEPPKAKMNHGSFKNDSSKFLAICCCISQKCIVLMYPLVPQTLHTHTHTHTCAPLTRSLEVPSLFSPSRGRRSAESLCVNWVACLRRRCWCRMALSLMASSPFFISLMVPSNTLLLGSLSPPCFFFFFFLVQR